MDYPPLAPGSFPVFKKTDNQTKNNNKKAFQSQAVGCVFSAVPPGPQLSLGRPVPHLTITLWAGSFGASGL